MSDFIHGGGGAGFNRTREFYGVQDYQDTATAGSPVALVLADTWYDLPNDGLGPLSSQDQAVLGHGAIFNTSTGEFDFSDLSIGDMVHFRFDVEFTTTSPNTDVRMRLAFGPAFVFTLPFQKTPHRDTVSGDDGREVRYFAFQMKTAATIDNPAKFQVLSDSTGDSVIVNGWQIETTLLT